MTQPIKTPVVASTLTVKQTEKAKASANLDLQVEDPENDIDLASLAVRDELSTPAKESEEECKCQSDTQNKT